MAVVVPTTLVDTVHTRLRSWLLSGDYQPAQRLRLADLASHFGVSQSVVREALNRLTAEQLVVAVPQQGFRVPDLSEDDLRELTEARVEVESVVLRLSMRRGGVEWESTVIAAHHRLARIATASDHDDPDVLRAWLVAHEAFHDAVLAGSGNSRLGNLARSLRASAGLYRGWSRALGEHRHRDVHAEHRALLDAILAGDENTATAVLCAHIQATTELLLGERDVDPATPREVSEA